MVTEMLPMYSSSFSESSFSSFRNNGSPTLGRIRRGSNRTMSCSYSDLFETVEIRGNATLCFDEDGTRFQGVIVADDRSLYSIQGKKSPRRNGGQVANSCNCNESFNEDYPEEQVLPVSFDIRIKDHDNPQEYQLRRVHGTNGQICKFSCDKISFTSQEVYRGHKADMVAQECLGHKIHGSKSQVYIGPFWASVQTREEPRHWVL
ncbi:uncharacterized protein LOC108668307 [Hyalella azteca]|uniref:Uncharacterized protein LOC108668307 n=1 Tax=Hyalella azteca TaxID=294128 RepID=A0A8B7NBS1_HYAAZ|nr:uncharacterized protein LOC108668307 [Hyalella azteca]